MDPSIEQVLDQLLPGERRFIPARLTPRPCEQRFLEIIGAEPLEGGAAAAGLAWVNSDEIELPPSTGGVRGMPVSLFSGPPMAVEIGEGKALDFYNIMSDLFIVSGKLKSIIDSIDMEAMEFRPATGPFDLEMYSAMPNRIGWFVDLDVTDIEISKREVIPGLAMHGVHYGSKIYMRGDIAENVHVFKDKGNPFPFWSRELVKACQDAGISGLKAVDMSGLRSAIRL